MKPVSLMGLVFEAYGVRAGTPYDVEFRLAPLAAAERIWRLEPDDLAF